METDQDSDAPAAAASNHSTTRAAAAASKLGSNAPSRIVLGVMNAVHALFDRLTSAAFILSVSTPFALWIVALLYVPQYLPAQSALVKAVGLQLVVVLWCGMAMIWAAIAAALKHRKHSQSVALAIAVLLGAVRCMPQSPAPSSGQTAHTH